MKAIKLQVLLGDLKKRAGNSYSGLVSDLSLLVGAATVLCGGTGALLPLLTLYTQKEKVVKLGARVLDLVAKTESAGEAGRVAKMRDAYCLLFITAFFDALDAALPEEARTALALSKGEERGLSRAEDAGELSFLDPVFGITAVEASLLPLYRAMRDTLRRFVQGLAFYEESPERVIRGFDEALESLPEKAAARFQDKLLAQRAASADFNLFILDERERENQTALLDSHRRFEADKARKIAEKLMKKYRTRITQPLWRDKRDLGRLRAPSIQSAFIPQSFRFCDYDGQQRLEDPRTWREIPLRRDMDEFWVDYLTQPASTERLLLILGEPGTGKSMLTEVLCGQFGGENRVLLRIPLRDHNMGEELETIVSRQMKKDAAAGKDADFAWFAEACGGSPITLIFDGYDEVMQATGAVFRSLLNQLRELQSRWGENGCPLRVVVTSRETMIDKADIPEGTAVLRLEEFDAEQQALWIHIWNTENREALQAAGLEAFSLPQGDTDVARLACQPLLLLMLALYDADFDTGENALRRDHGLNRTQLYDRLLRRFVRRELQKGGRPGEPCLAELNEEQQQQREDEELRVLGIVALGMFERGRLYLLAEELREDLKCMEVDARRDGVENRGRVSLSDEEAVFGSFFFIHRPRVKNRKGRFACAYEFLHKTFYEFLLADLLYTYLLETAKGIGLRRTSPEGEQSAAPYFVALGSALLPGEPGVVRMLGEWKAEKLERYVADGSLTREALLKAVDGLFEEHSQRLLEGRFAFPPVQGDFVTEKHPFPQRAAAYLMNLLILCIQLNEEYRVPAARWRGVSRYLWLNATQQRTGEDAAEDPAEENILSFMALFELPTEEDPVKLRAQRRAYDKKDLSRAEAHIARFTFLQDDTTRRLYRLFDRRVEEWRKQRYRRVLLERGLEMGFDYYLAALEQGLRYPEETRLDKVEDALFWMLRTMNFSVGELRLCCMTYAVLRVLDKTTPEERAASGTGACDMAERVRDMAAECYGEESELAGLLRQTVERLESNPARPEADFAPCR